jgi:hypothetical protein
VVGIILIFVILVLLIVPVPLEAPGSDDAKRFGGDTSNISKSVTATSEVEWRYSNGLVLEDYDTIVSPVPSWSNGSEGSYRSVQSIDLDREVFYSKIVFDEGVRSKETWQDSSGSYVREVARTQESRAELREKASEQREHGTKDFMFEDESDYTAMVWFYEASTETNYKDLTDNANPMHHRDSSEVCVEPDGTFVGCYSPVVDVQGEFEEKGDIGFSGSYTVKDPTSRYLLDDIYGERNVPLAFYLFGSVQSTEVSYERETGGSGVPDERPGWVEKADEYYGNN